LRGWPLVPLGEQPTLDGSSRREVRRLLAHIRALSFR
jgi:hypothetical protein